MPDTSACEPENFYNVSLSQLSFIVAFALGAFVKALAIVPTVFQWRYPPQVTRPIVKFIAVPMTDVVTFWRRWIAVKCGAHKPMHRKVRCFAVLRGIMAQRIKKPDGP